MNEATATVHRRLCREIASQIIAAMAYRDMSFDAMAEAIGSTGAAVKKKLDRLIAGASISLRDVADLAFALNCSVRFSLTAREPEEPPAPTTDSGQPETADGDKS